MHAIKIFITIDNIRLIICEIATGLIQMSFVRPCEPESILNHLYDKPGKDHLPNNLLKKPFFLGLVF
jgi:hypothetical protein